MITKERIAEIQNLVYELESDGQFVAVHAIEDLLSALDRAHEALEALRQHESMGALVVKYRLGAYLFPEDALVTIIDFGLGKRDADPSVRKEDK